MAFESTPSQTLITTVITASVALLGVTLSALFTWLKDLNQLSRRSRILDYEARRIDLWQKIVSLRKEISVSDFDNVFHLRFIQGEIEDTLEFFRNGYDLPFVRRHFSDISFWRRWLLLYKPLNKWTWITRAIFYVLASITIKSLMNLGSDVIQRQEWAGDAALFVFMLLFIGGSRKVSLQDDEERFWWDRFWRESAEAHDERERKKRS